MIKVSYTDILLLYKLRVRVKYLSGYLSMRYNRLLKLSVTFSGIYKLQNDSVSVQTDLGILPGKGVGGGVTLGWGWRWRG